MQNLGSMGICHAWQFTLVIPAGSIAQMSIDRQIYNSQQRSSQTGSAKGQTARLGSCSSDQFYDYGFNLTWMEATPESVEESEDEAMRRNDSHSPLDDESPTFVLSRGHVTPNNLLPGWDDEDEGPWGPRKEYCPQTRRRSGQLATFDERLQEVCVRFSKHKKDYRSRWYCPEKNRSACGDHGRNECS